MSTNSSDKIFNALAVIGNNSKSRETIVASLLLAEKNLACQDFNVRNEITGPIVDALYRDVETQCKVLQQGLSYYFSYQGNIHRELVMSVEEHPDHVWEPQTTRLLMKLAESASTVIIGGAYSGDQALLVAHSLRGHGRVFCFEPNESERNQLQLNITKNGLTNVHIDERGLWSSDGVHLSLADAEDHSHSGSALADENNSDAFPAISLATFCSEQKIASVDLIMLDIEGGEQEALKGAELFLKMESDQAPNLIFEVHSSYVDWSKGLDKTDIIKYVTDCGYTAYAIRDFQGNWPLKDQPIELILPQDAYLDGPPHGFNVLAVKDRKILDGQDFILRKGVSPKYLRHRDPNLHGPLEA